MSPQPRGRRRVCVVGGGPSGLTAALLLGRAGHAVTVLEAAAELGGLWATRLDADGCYGGENSCKVYQAGYHTAPALFRLIGTRWEDHFTPRHDLRSQWLLPFLRDCTRRDLACLGRDFGLFVSGVRSFRGESVAGYLARRRIGEAARAWLRATALGGITGTLNMTVWELFHRFQANLSSILTGRDGTLYWNARPPNSAGGFVDHWRAALDDLGVTVETGCSVCRLEGRGPVRVSTQTGARGFDAAFLAVPPPALGRLLAESADEVALGFGRDRPGLDRVLAESVYAHLGLVWLFDRPLPRDLPLGGHNVLRGWHPILVQHPQYRPWLPPPAVTAVVGSVSLDTDFRHHRLGTLARDHAPDELARILWQDERAADPSLPAPVSAAALGVSAATQIVAHGPLPVRASTAPVFVATNLNGLAPYFTSSLEAAIQAGAAAAAAFDPAVERLPTGASAWSGRRWR